jgi:polysaccharide biosynthesis protein PslH
MRKVLFVAPFLTHPSTTGASARVRHMADAVLSLGHEVHFLHLQQTLRSSDSRMREYWKERLHVFNSLSPTSLMRRGRRKLVRVVGKTFHLNLPVDSYFDPGAARCVRRLLEERGFDVAIISYVFYSRLFESAPASVLKLIDTHDVFSDRYRLYRKHGQANEFFSTSRVEEAKALDRSDCVLAIQDWDAKHFRSLTTRPVVVVGHLTPPASAPNAVPAPSDPAILFVGSSMGINLHGVRWFIEHVLPRVRRQVPQAELWLVGGIADRVNRSGPGVRRWGFVEAVDDLYRRAAVVINPQQFGTGLSIKSIDALRHGRPLVTTPAGARGLEQGGGVAFSQAESATEFAAAIIELLRDPARAAALAQRAVAFVEEYHRRNLKVLAEVVNGALPR